MTSQPTELIVEPAPSLPRRDKPSMAGTPEYAREYHRLRRLGLPTAGLAERMRNGVSTTPDLSHVSLQKRTAAEQLIARGLANSEIMRQLGIPYGALRELRDSML